MPSRSIYSALMAAIFRFEVNLPTRFTKSASIWSLPKPFVSWMHLHIKTFRAGRDAHMDVFICSFKMCDPIRSEVRDEHPEIVRTAPTATLPAFKRSVSGNDRIACFKSRKMPLH